jgi:hypothetical protein
MLDIPRFLLRLPSGGFAGRSKFAPMLNRTPHEGEWRDGVAAPRILTECLTCVINIAASIPVQISILRPSIRNERPVLFLMPFRSLLG